MIEAFVVPVVMTKLATYCLEDIAESQELVHEGRVDSTNRCAKARNYCTSHQSKLKVFIAQMSSWQALVVPFQCDRMCIIWHPQLHS